MKNCTRHFSLIKSVSLSRICPSFFLPEPLRCICQGSILGLAKISTFLRLLSSRSRKRMWRLVAQHSRIPTLLKRILTQCILRCFYFNFILSIYIYSFLVKEHKTYLYRFSNNTGSLNLYSIFNKKNFPSLFRLGLIKKNIFYMFFLCAMMMVPLVI